jgi:hypothetical protein
MAITKNYLHVPGSATIGQVLQAYRNRRAEWNWLLVAETEGQFSVCSFGSLLPYLTGRTEHIVHNIGDCTICCSIDPMLWKDTGRLVREALADRAIRSRRVADLPMAELRVVEARREDESPSDWYRRRSFGRAVGVAEDGALIGVDVQRYRGDSGGLPAF